MIRLLKIAAAALSAPVAEYLAMIRDASPITVLPEHRLVEAEEDIEVWESPLGEYPPLDPMTTTAAPPDGSGSQAGAVETPRSGPGLHLQDPA